MFERDDTGSVITFPFNRSKIKLTTRELKLALKQATIMLEDFYPSHVLNRIIDQQGTESSENEVGAVLNQLEAMHGNGVSVPKHVGILEKGAVKSGARRGGPTESKFATVEEWWDSKGLTLGMLFSD